MGSQNPPDDMIPIHILRTLLVTKIFEQSVGLFRDI
jgi:hypothetical protein